MTTFLKTTKNWPSKTHKKLSRLSDCFSDVFC